MITQFQYPLTDRLGWNSPSHGTCGKEEAFQYPLTDRLGWNSEATPQAEKKSRVSVSSNGSIGVEPKDQAAKWPGIGQFQYPLTDRLGWNPVSWLSMTMPWSCFSIL